MYQLQNDHINHLDEPSCDDQISAKIFEQVMRARNSVFDEISDELGISEYKDIRVMYLNKRSVSKEKLSSWLETVCCILDKFCIPRLQTAVERVEELTLKRIDDQSTIIDLQSKLIEKRDEELKSLQDTVQKEVKSVQNTVQTEMKSYSSALTKTCSAALAPKKIRAAVKSVADREDRSKNVIIYGVAETNDEVLSDKVREVLEKTGESPMVRDCCRVGMKKPSIPRPVKFSLNSSDMVSQLLKKSRQLRSKEGYSAVYICPDRTVEERKAYKKLIEELKEKRVSEPNKVFIIRNNKVVCSDKNSVPAQPGKT